MRFILIVLLASLLLGCASQGVEEAQTPSKGGTVGANMLSGATNLSYAEPSNFTLHVLYFYGGACQYSAKATPTLKQLNASYSDKNVTIHFYEVWYDKGNKALYDRIADAYGIAQDNRGVPVIFIDGEYLMTYQRINQYLEQEINVCLRARCPNPLDALTNASIAKPI